MTAQWQVQVVRHGHEQEPVLVIDNFVADPQGWVEDACTLSFSANSIHYPGVRAAVAPAMVRASLKGLDGLLSDTFGIAATSVLESHFSLVTTPPAALTPIQRLPHFDSNDGGRIALLHFLCDRPDSGTAFFRHRSTGYETVSAERLAPFKVALAADLQTHSVPAPAYIAGDTPIYERVARHAAVFNRAILYRGITLHCADIPDDDPLSRDPAAGRLTVNTFLDAA